MGVTNLPAKKSGGLVQTNKSIIPYEGSALATDVTRGIFEVLSNWIKNIDGDDSQSSLKSD